jgi:isomerase DpgB
MVIGRPADAAGHGQVPAAAGADLVIRIDGGQPVSPELIAALTVACDAAEDDREHGVVIAHVSGAPQGLAASARSVATVSKWERVLRRVERLRAVTIAVAEGDCGGPALEALLVTDYRIAVDGARLLMTAEDGVIWPGMALYRLCHQAGTGAARRTVLFGAPIEAGPGLAMGLIDELAGDVTGALAIATEVAAAWSATELAIRRQLMQDASSSTFENALGVHLAACDRVLRSAPGRGHNGNTRSRDG